MNQEQFVAELSKLKAGATFLSLNRYVNAANETANYNIVFHISYENALKRSIDTLKAMDLTSDLDKHARSELLESFGKSLNKAVTISIDEIADAYTRFFDKDGNYIKGVKLHRNSNTLHLYGLVVNKKVLVPGFYDKDNRSPLVVAKDHLRSKCSVGKFRQFKMTPNQVESISVQNLKFLPPED